MSRARAGRLPTFHRARAWRDACGRPPTDRTPSSRPARPPRVGRVCRAAARRRAGPRARGARRRGRRGACGQAGGQGAEPERREPEPAPAPARSPRPPRPPPPRGPLTTHEWLTDPPDDLGTSWIVLSRPEGVRVTLEAGGGRTLARAAGGRGARVPLAPPRRLARDRGRAQRGLRARLRVSGRRARGGGGARRRLRGRASVRHPLDRRRHVPRARRSRVGRRRHGAVHGRHAAVWLGPKLAECGAAGDPLPSGARSSPSRTRPRPHPPCPPPRGPPCRAWGGVLLLHAEGAYERGAANPLALVWKDALCSRHPVDTGPGGVAAPMQTATLRVGADGATVETGDDPPVALATAADLPPPGALARFIVGPDGFAFTPDGAPAGADLAPAPGPPPRARARRADAFSKLLFQAAARAGTGVTLEMLCEAAGASAAAGGMEVG